MRNHRLRIAALAVAALASLSGAGGIESRPVAGDGWIARTQQHLAEREYSRSLDSLSRWQAVCC